MTSGAGAISSASTWSSDALVRPRASLIVAAGLLAAALVGLGVILRAQRGALPTHAPCSIAIASAATTRPSARAASRSTGCRSTTSMPMPRSGSTSCAKCARASCRRPASRAPSAPCSTRFAAALEQRLDAAARAAPNAGLQGRLAPQPRRVRERHSRPARLRCRRHRRDAAGRRRDPGLRQRRRGADRVADADRELRDRGAEDQPRSRRRSRARRRRKSSTRRQAAAQASHVDGLPLGTRGGFKLTHAFPLDATYELRVRARGPGPLAGQRFCPPPRIDVTLDGAPLAVADRERDPACALPPGRAR